MKTSPHPDFVDYWERGALWRIGVRVWKERCQAIKCDANGPGTSMVLAESSYALPLTSLQGKTPVPLIVFAIATHMMTHPESDLLDVLACRKTLAAARQDARSDYGGASTGADSARRC